MNSDSNVDDLSTEMASASLDDGGTDPEQLLFKPPLDSKAYKSLDDIPRYLYRVFVPSSDAKTDSIWVRSKSVLQGRSSSTKDIFDYENQQSIAYQLNMHLRWRRNGYAENNFVSWTSSLLFAIQYIYYRRFKDHDKPSLNDIELHVIDTTSFPTGTFMRDLDLMDFFGEYDYDRHPHYYPPNYNLPNLRTFRNEHLEGYYFGEYLSQGSLKIESNFQMITANVLFDNDRLHRLQPAFAALYRDPEDGVPKWADAVIDLRKAIWPQTTRLLSSAEINRRLQAVKEIVDNSAPSYRFPLGIYLAALTGTESTTEDQGTADDNVIFQFFRLGTWDGQEHSGFQPFNFDVIAPDTMPELKHVQTLVRETHKHFLLTQALNSLREAQTNIRNLQVMTVPSGNAVGAIIMSDPNRALERVGRKVQLKLRIVQGLCGRTVSANA